MICVMESKFDKVYGCRHSLNDDIMRVADVMVGEQRALVYHLGGNYYSFDALQAYCFGINIKL